MSMCASSNPKARAISRSHCEFAAMTYHCHSRLLAFGSTRLEAWTSTQSAHCRPSLSRWYTCTPATVDCRWASLTTRQPPGAGRLCTSSCRAASWGTCGTARRPSTSACAPATSPPGALAAGARAAASLHCPVRFLAPYQPALFGLRWLPHHKCFRAPAHHNRSSTSQLLQSSPHLVHYSHRAGSSGGQPALSRWRRRLMAPLASTA